MTGVEMIVQERLEQIEKHKMDAAHDDQYTEEELPRAARDIISRWKTREWPWSKEWWERIMHRHTRQEELAIAGALIAAEIDRLNRLENSVNNSGESL